VDVSPSAGNMGRAQLGQLEHGPKTGAQNTAQHEIIRAGLARPEERAGPCLESRPVVPPTRPARAGRAWAGPARNGPSKAPAAALKILWRCGRRRLVKPSRRIHSPSRDSPSRSVLLGSRTLAATRQPCRSPVYLSIDLPQSQPLTLPVARGVAPSPARRSALSSTGDSCVGRT